MNQNQLFTQVDYSNLLRRISELECPLPTDAAIAMNLCFQKFLTRVAFLHIRSQYDWEVAKKFDELTSSTLPLGQEFKAFIDKAKKEVKKDKLLEKQKSEKSSFPRGRGTGQYQP
jgi:hypothetical protein